MRLIFFSLFFLSPPSVFQDLPVSIFGKEHRFPRQVFEQIVEAKPQDADAIAQLSAEMPPIYSGMLSRSYLPFRHKETYEKMLRGIDVQSKARRKRHLFFVFKDGDGKVRGYVHGTAYLNKPLATVDEMAVDPAYRRGGVARALMGKLLQQFSERNKSAVQVLSRVEIVDKLVASYGLKSTQTGFDISLVTDHIISRFSLNYLMTQDTRNVSLLKEIAKEMKSALEEAKVKDGIKTDEAIHNLHDLANAMDKAIQGKIIRRRENFYIGIQDDRLELAHVYFAIYLLSVLSAEDQDPADRAHYKRKNEYFEATLYNMQQAQRQGGYLPAWIQLFIGRLHAFARFYEGEVKGTPVDKAWVQRSVRQYLDLFDLNEIDGHQIDVYPAFHETAIREILWFRYPYPLACRMARKMMEARSKLIRLAEKRKLKPARRDQEAFPLFQEMRREFNLSPEFLLLFLYSLPVSSKSEMKLHRRVGKLLTWATFYTFDPEKEDWDDRRPRNFQELAKKGSPSWKKQELPQIKRRNSLTAMQKRRIRWLMAELDGNAEFDFSL